MAVIGRPRLEAALEQAQHLLLAFGIESKVVLYLLIVKVYDWFACSDLLSLDLGLSLEHDRGA